ncbi:hypothetical protein QNH14_09290 [Apirhabdus apintestini]|nr:hypothetical protein QNH14_09290 [Enterobacteriaceae bacterium CA-0114]
MAPGNNKSTKRVRNNAIFLSSVFSVNACYQKPERGASLSPGAFFAAPGILHAHLRQTYLTALCHDDYDRFRFSD